MSCDHKHPRDRRRIAVRLAGCGTRRGHYHYRIDCRRGVYEVSATIGRRFPGPGERSFQPSTMTQVLHKDDREAADFLARLTLEHKVCDKRRPFERVA